MKELKFAVLGTPIGHSLSPDIHKIFADGCGIDIEYKKIETDKYQLRDTVKRLIDEGYSGFNCTMPLKAEMAGLLNKNDVKSEQVKLLGVCNTVKIEEDKLCGHVTDGDGMIEGIKFNGFEVAGKSVMMLGTGDTSKAVLLALIRNKAKKVSVLNRSKSNLDATKNLFDSLIKDCDISFELLNIENMRKNIENDIDIFINTTKLGMKDADEHTDLNFIDIMKKGTVVVDAVYNPLYTQLLVRARDRELPIVDGFWMLVYQGLLAFEIWTSLKVPDDYIKMAHNIIRR